MENIVNQAVIRKENLDQSQYTLSLLKEGFRAGLINRHLIDRFQKETIFILKDLIMRYTHGESTSVKVETAEEILNSIYYCIDAYMSSFINPEYSISILKEKEIREIYEQGFELIRLCFQDTKTLYNEIVKNKLDVPLVAYNDTIDKALPDFFKQYEAVIVFNAHDTMGSIDYPLVFDDMNISGIFYIKQYLEKLEIETKFCSIFDREDTIKVLENYGKAYNIVYTEALINIFEILINNSICSVILGNNANGLIISEFQSKLLKEKLSSLSFFQLSYLVNEAVEKIIETLYIDKSELIDYIHRYKTIFMHRMVNALENSNLNYIIIADSIENCYDSSIVFKEGNRMDNQSFRTIIRRIIECEKTEDKIKIITSNIHSLEDFIDILKADCLFGEEFTDVFNTLSDMELSILGRIVFYEELRVGSLDLSYQIISKRNMETEWQVQYIKFIQGLNNERINSIEGFINDSGITYNIKI